MVVPGTKSESGIDKRGETLYSMASKAFGPYPFPAECPSMDKKVGLYGFLIHIVIVSFFLALRNLQGEQLNLELSLVAVPLLLLSSFLVYAVVVSRYVQRRAGMQKPAVIDSLVGILSEYMIFTITAVLLGLYDGLRSGYGSGAVTGQTLLTAVLMSLLWVYATFMVQILVLGNLCGLVGWLLLRKKNEGQ